MSMSRSFTKKSNHSRSKPRNASNCSAVDGWMICIAGVYPSGKEQQESCQGHSVAATRTASQAASCRANEMLALAGLVEGRGTNRRALSVVVARTYLEN